MKSIKAEVRPRRALKPAAAADSLKMSKEEELKEQVKKMSTHELINNPTTLTAGVWHLHQQITSTLGALPYDNGYSSSDSHHKLRVQKGRKKLAPKKPPSAAATLVKEEKMEEDLLSVYSSSNSCPPSDFVMSEVEESVEESTDERLNPKLLQEKGAAQFGELFDRFELPAPSKICKGDSSWKKINEEFDLDADGLFMKSLFPDYENKERLYTKHCKKIQELSSDDIMQYFDKIKSTLLDILEGRLETHRMNLFLSEDEVDLQVLKGLALSAPFTNNVYMAVANAILEYLFPKRKARPKYMNYIRLVLIPEALIRLYGVINDVNISHAETEMKFGPQYDGAIPRSVRRKGESRRSGEKSKSKKKKTKIETVVVLPDESKPEAGKLVVKLET